MHSEICDAVLDLVSDGATLSSLSLVSVARETGFSRNSIYRRWTSKEALYVDVVTSMKRLYPDLAEPSARENLITLLAVTFERATDKKRRRMGESIVAEARTFPGLYEQYLQEIVTPFNHAMKSTIRRGKESREIRPDVDEDLLCEVLVASISTQILSDSHGVRDRESVSRRITDLVFGGVSPQ
jgi:AcrR family transcriptional regulator